MNGATFVLDKPGAPEDLKVKSTTESTVRLSWSPPANDGGSEITKYVIERRDTSKRTWMAAGTTSGSTLEFTIENLSEKVAYSFRVAAENACGVGEFAEMDKTVSPKSQFSEYFDKIILIKSLSSLARFF